MNLVVSRLCYCLGGETYKLIVASAQTYMTYINCGILIEITP